MAYSQLLAANIPYYTFWVLPKRLLAGEYPGAKNRADPLPRLQALLNLGVDRFIDLTEAGEYGIPAYDALAKELANKSGRSITHQRLAIHDVSVPSKNHMFKILNAIDEALGGGHTVYVHCYAGIGRTGTTIGCYLVRHGMLAESALQQLADWLSHTAKAGRPIPETPEQADFIRSWCENIEQTRST
ncbi:MAG: protein-tyrosine phosphatase family protein [Anaerolineae bacterium]